MQGLTVISLRPITSRAISRIFGTDLKSQAAEVVEVGSATSRTGHPAIAMPDELDRIVRHHPDSCPAFNFSRLLDPIVHQGPAITYRIQDAVIADGCVLSPRARQALRKGKRRWVLDEQPERFETAALCSYWVTEQYFAHWLIDTPSHELLARDLDAIPLTLAPTRYSHEPDYRALLSLPKRGVDYARIDDLWVLEDHELNDHRVSRIERNRSELRSTMSGQGPSHVFISRGVTGIGRILANEAKIADVLAARGFTILRPEQEDVRTIVESLYCASIIVSVEGSAIAHAVMAAPKGCGFLVLQPPRHFNSLFKSHSDAFGFRFGYTVGEVVSDEVFIQPIDRLLRAIDLLESAVAKG